MFIYTGNADGKSLEEVKSRGMGIMIASSAGWKPRKGYGQVRCALDNGAFQCYRRGFPFMESVFIDSIEEAYRVGISLDFIACPDVVAGGLASLDFSMSWAKGRLATVPRLALVVQDGIAESDLLAGYHLPRFTHLFIGGTVEWKWRTAASWVAFGHKHGKSVHIGQCGTLERILYADMIGADSVDSTSIVRNNRWDIVDKYDVIKSGQDDLFIGGVE